MNRMTTIVGIKTKEGVVLGSNRRASKGFFIGSKVTQKIAKIDDTLAVAIAGQLSLMNYKQISNEGEVFEGGELQ
jgi:proteasome beta subunit